MPEKGFLIRYKKKFLKNPGENHFKVLGILKFIVVFWRKTFLEDFINLDFHLYDKFFIKTDNDILKVYNEVKQKHGRGLK